MKFELAEQFFFDKLVIIFLKNNKCLTIGAVTKFFFVQYFSAFTSNQDTLNFRLQLGYFLLRGLVNSISEEIQSFFFSISEMWYRAANNYTASFILNSLIRNFQLEKNYRTFVFDIVFRFFTICQFAVLWFYSRTSQLYVQNFVMEL